MDDLGRHANRLLRATARSRAGDDQLWAMLARHLDDLCRLARGLPAAVTDEQLVKACVVLVAGELARQRAERLADEAGGTL